MSVESLTVKGLC